MAEKLAVLFPGVGYTCSKPLLYYTASAASDLGYQIERLDYGQDIHTFKGRSQEDLLPVTELALKRILPRLGDLNIPSYKEVVFISKSIGTVIACQAEEALGLPRPVRHFLMTPIPAALPYLNKVDGVFFSGTGDPYISSQLILKAARDFPDKAGILFDGCDHSLEIKGDTIGNLYNIKQIVAYLTKMLEG